MVAGSLPDNLFIYSDEDHDSILKQFILTQLGKTPISFEPIKLLLDRLFTDLFTNNHPQLNPREPFYMLTIICDLLPIQLINHLLPVLFQKVDMIREFLAPEYEKKMVLLESLNKAPQKLKSSIINLISRAMTSLLNRCKDIDYVLRGKIYLFLQSVLPIFEKSQLNLQGEFNQGISITIDPKGDVDESSISEGTFGYKDEDIILSSTRTDIPYHTYTNFWKLQSYIRSAKDIVNLSVHSNEWKDFTRCMDENIQLLKIHIQHNDSSMEEIEYNPTNLTNKNLFYFQLRNSSFKRQVLSQLIILCTTLEKGIGLKGSIKQFSSETQIHYVQTIGRIAKKLLYKIPDSESNFGNIASAITDLLIVDEFWKDWKENDGCVNLLQKPLPNNKKYSEGPTEDDIKDMHPHSTFLRYGVKNLQFVLNDTNTTKNHEFLKEIHQRPRKRKYDEIASGDVEIMRTPSYMWNGLRLWAESDLKTASRILTHDYPQLIMGEVEGNDDSANDIINGDGESNSEVSSLSILDETPQDLMDTNKDLQSNYEENKEPGELEDGSHDEDTNEFEASIQQDVKSDEKAPEVLEVDNDAEAVSNVDRSQDEKNQTSEKEFGNSPTNIHEVNNLDDKMEDVSDVEIMDITETSPTTMETANTEEMKEKSIPFTKSAITPSQQDTPPESTTGKSSRESPENEQSVSRGRRKIKRQRFS